MLKHIIFYMISEFDWPSSDVTAVLELKPTMARLWLRVFYWARTAQIPVKSFLF